jgi:hypothetical protein
MPLTFRTILSALVLGGCIAPVDGELDDVGSVSEPLVGPAPMPPTSQSNTNVDGANIWSDAQGSNVWSDVILGDVDGNGYADLCGRYGNSYGCVRRLGNTYFEGAFMEAVSFATSAASTLRTIRIVDANSDGFGDLCGRTSGGIVCQLSTGTSFSAGTTWNGDFTTAGGWAVPQHYLTIGFPRLHNVAGGAPVPAVCGRGHDGIVCYLRNAARTAFTTAVPMQTAFSDANGWTAAHYYSTIQYADIDADGDDDVCGRGTAGIHCAEWLDGAIRQWDSADLMTTQFRDAAGWTDPIYYSSIRLGDVNGDLAADVCGRGTAGVYCGISSPSFGTFRHASTLSIPGMSNAAGWDLFEMFYASLMIVDFDNDNRGDVCAVGPHNGITDTSPEIHCARSRTGLTPRFDALSRRTDDVLIVDRVAPGKIHSDANGFCWADVGGEVSCTNHW